GGAGASSACAETKKAASRSAVRWARMNTHVVRTRDGRRQLGAGRGRVRRTGGDPMTRMVRNLLLAVFFFVPAVGRTADVFDLVRDHYADSSGVRIHYVTRGHGPLVVMIHGFPDFWYGWRDQIAVLARH